MGRKAEEPLKILEFLLPSIPTVLAVWNPISKKLADEAIGAVVKRAPDFIKWLASAAAAKIADLGTKRVVFESEYLGCRVALVVDARHPAAVIAGTRVLDQGLRLARSFIEANQGRMPENLNLEFAQGATRWAISHGSLKALGAFSQRPIKVEIATTGGLSLEGPADRSVAEDSARR